MAYAVRGNHPVLQQQAEMNSGVVGEPEGFFTELGASIDETPAFVAGLVIGALGIMFAMKQAGFRFNFGVGAKVG